MERVRLFDIDIHNVTMDEALDEMMKLIDSNTFSYAVTPNVDHILKLRKDEVFSDIYRTASMILPDGVPLLWAARAAGCPLKERINGTDFFERACARAAEEGLSVFFLGGAPGAAFAACDRLQERHPGLRIAGWHCPPHGFENDSRLNTKIQREIKDSGADILFVGLGAPKQEQWMYLYGEGTGAHFAAGVGVSFSFVAGKIPRAPRWMQRGGLEWCWRLAQEPGRLWKRYLFGGPKFLARFVALVFRARLSSIA
jgi:N-acetylglucosaminyldiphosphoundecaprenol N-acetyl-beta-D-mannosaminyltransferase